MHVDQHENERLLSKAHCLTSLHMLTELSQRLVGEAFYNGELESELRRIGKVDFRFKKDSDRDKCMEMIEIERRCNMYPHPSSECVDECGKREVRSI